jgi:hypothetical protein
MPGLTVDDVAARLRVYVKPNIDDTVPAWYASSQVLADALQSANNEIVAALGARGFSASQAQAWFRYTEYQADLSLWWIGVKASALNEERLDVGQLLKLDRRWELTPNPKGDVPAQALIDSNGVPIAPAAAPVAGVGHGRCEDTAERQRRLAAEQRQRERGGPLEYFPW